MAIVRERVPHASARLVADVTSLVQALRAEELYKAPGVSETLDWVAAVVALGRDTLDPDVVEATLGVVLKSRDDIEGPSRATRSSL